MTTRAGIRNFSREDDLAVFVARYLRNRRFRSQMQEVPFFEYRMDIYGYSRRDNLTVAVELKLRRWSRAVEQALLYQLCSDFVYIAMPSAVVGSVDSTVLEKYGIGLLSVRTDRCSTVLQARRSAVLRRHYRDRYVALVSGGTVRI